VYASFDTISDLWAHDALFQPRLDAAQRDRLYRGWLEAVSRVRSAR